MAKPGEDKARKAALTLLQGVRDGLSLADQSASLKALTPSEQARAARLAAETLRHQSRADLVLADYVSRKPAPQIADVLRLGTVELLHLGGAAHGVVHANVTLCRGLGKRGNAAAGMVNAVLRKVSRHQGWQDLPPQPMPDWLRGPVVAAYGEDAAIAIEAAHQNAAPLDLTVKSTATTLENAEPLPTGSLRLRGQVQVSALPGFESGDWWVQDAAAALPVRLLDPQPDEHIADLCAAPGARPCSLPLPGPRSPP